MTKAKDEGFKLSPVEESALIVMKLPLLKLNRLQLPLDQFAWRPWLSRTQTNLRAKSVWLVGVWA